MKPLWHKAFGANNKVGNLTKIILFSTKTLYFCRSQIL